MPNRLYNSVATEKVRPIQGSCKASTKIVIVNSLEA